MRLEPNMSAQNHHQQSQNHYHLSFPIFSVRNVMKHDGYECNEKKMFCSEKENPQGEGLAVILKVAFGRVHDTHVLRLCFMYYMRLDINRKHLWNICLITFLKAS